MASLGRVEAGNSAHEGEEEELEEGTAHGRDSFGDELGTIEQI